MNVVPRDGPLDRREVLALSPRAWPRSLAAPFVWSGHVSLEGGRGFGLLSWRGVADVKDFVAAGTEVTLALSGGSDLDAVVVSIHALYGDPWDPNARGPHFAGPHAPHWGYRLRLEGIGPHRESAAARV